MATEPRATAHDLSGRVADLDASFFAAAEGGTVDHNIVVGGEPVRLRFASGAMAARLAPAFAHVARAEPGPPSLLVHIWDSATTGTPAPPVPPGPPEEHPGAWRVYEGAGERWAYRPVVGELTVVAPGLRRAWFWMPDAARVPLYERAAPLRLVWHWGLGGGRHLVHAGAAGHADGGVLFVGKSGSGKSSAAVACLEAGLAFASDDYVLVGEEPPSIYSLYASAKLEPDHALRFPRIAAAEGERTTDDPYDTDKSVYMLGDRFAGQLAPHMPLRAILTPRVRLDRRETCVRPVGARDALLGLAPSTLLQLPGSQRDTLAGLSRLVQRVPCFAMECGTDIAGVAQAVTGLLDELRGAA